MASVAGGGLLSVIVPCFNEEQNIKPFYEELVAELAKVKKDLLPCLEFELIFINDGSSDGTLNALLGLDDARIVAIDFSRNFGKEAAIYAGLAQAKGDFVICLDADGQDPIWLISSMIELRAKFDYIGIFRINRTGEGKMRAFLGNAFYWLYNHLNSTKLKVGARDFCLMERKVVDAVLCVGEYHRFSKAIFEWVGFRRTYLSYEYIPRTLGKSGWSFWKLFGYGLDGLISFSIAPLRLSFLIGFLMFALALIYGLFIVFDVLLFGSTVKGWASLMCVMVFFGGVQLIVLGIIGEYIGRIYEQSKHRPKYLISQIYNQNKPPKSPNQTKANPHPTKAQTRPKEPKGQNPYKEIL